MISFYRYADTVGDGTGSREGAVNGSVTPVVLRLMPRAGETSLEVHNMMVHIMDVGLFDTGKYGNNIVLTNGISVGVYNADGSLDRDLMDGEPIKLNVEWHHVCYDASLSTYGTGDASLSVSWPFTRAGMPIILEFGESICITLADDLTGLTHHAFRFEGIAHG